MHISTAEGHLVWRLEKKGKTCTTETYVAIIADVQVDWRLLPLSGVLAASDVIHAALHVTWNVWIARLASEQRSKQLHALCSLCIVKYCKDGSKSKK